MSESGPNQCRLRAFAAIGGPCAVREQQCNARLACERAGPVYGAFGIARREADRIRYTCYDRADLEFIRVHIHLRQESLRARADPIGLFGGAAVMRCQAVRRDGIERAAQVSREHVPVAEKPISTAHEFMYSGWESVTNIDGRNSLLAAEIAADLLYTSRCDFTRDSDSDSLREVGPMSCPNSVAAG